MAAKKLTRENKVNFIKKNLKLFKPRSKADANKFEKFEESNDKQLDVLYKVIQGCIRRKNQRETSSVAKEQVPTNEVPTNEVQTKKNKKNKKNDIFKKFGLDKGADLATLESYQKDAQALLDAVISRIQSNKEAKKVSLEKSIAQLQKELSEIQ